MWVTGGSRCLTVHVNGRVAHGEWVTQALCLPIVPVTEGAGRCWKGGSQEALALGELGAMSP